MLFFDKNYYNKKVDYEIEYEIDKDVNMIDGLFEFNHFLIQNNIPFIKQKSKSKRAIESTKKEVK